MNYTADGYIATGVAIMLFNPCDFRYRPNFGRAGLAELEDSILTKWKAAL